MATTISITPKSKVGLFILMAAYQPQSTLLTKLETAHGSELLLTSAETAELIEALRTPKALEGIGRHRWIAKLKTEIGYQPPDPKKVPTVQVVTTIQKLEDKLLRKKVMI